MTSVPSWGPKRGLRSTSRSGWSQTGTMLAAAARGFWNSSMTRFPGGRTPAQKKPKWMLSHSISWWTHCFIVRCANEHFFRMFWQLNFDSRVRIRFHFDVEESGVAHHVAAPTEMQLLRRQPNLRLFFEAFAEQPQNHFRVSSQNRNAILDFRLFFRCLDAESDDFQLISWDVALCFAAFLKAAIKDKRELNWSRVV